MADRKIVVEIDANGAVKVETAGYTGPDCVQATKKFLDALGGGDTKHKPEFHQRSQRQCAKQ